MLRLALLAAALTTPALAQTHEAVNGAVSGRSPTTIMRPIARAEASCDAIRPGTPGGKLATHYHRAKPCSAPNDVVAQNAAPSDQRTK